MIKSAEDKQGEEETPGKTGGGDAEEEEAEEEVSHAATHCNGPAHAEEPPPVWPS